MYNTPIEYTSIIPPDLDWNGMDDQDKRTKLKTR